MLMLQIIEISSEINYLFIYKIVLQNIQSRRIQMPTQLFFHTQFSFYQTKVNLPTQSEMNIFYGWPGERPIANTENNSRFQIIHDCNSSFGILCQMNQIETSAFSPFRA